MAYETCRKVEQINKVDVERTRTSSCSQELSRSDASAFERLSLSFPFNQSSLI